MPFNGAGTFTRIYSWATDKANNVKITASRMDAETDGLATGLSTCITKDGQTTVTANLPMNSKKHTGVAAGTARTEYADVGSVQDALYSHVSTVGGTANAITLTPSPAISAYVAGQRFTFISSAENTGATTVAVSGLAAKAIQWGGVALVAGQIRNGVTYQVVYDGTAFQIMGAVGGESAQWGGTSGGSGNAQTLTPLPVIGAYVAGQRFLFIAGATNTGATTIAVSGLAAKNLYIDNAACVGGEIVINRLYQIVYDGTQFQLLNAQPFATQAETDARTVTNHPLVPSMVAGGLGIQGSDIASASTLTLPTVGDYFNVTGTTTVTAISSRTTGREIETTFGGALVLTHSSPALVLPGAANITTVAGDTARWRSTASGQWKCVRYTRADGTAVVAASTTGGAGSVATTATTLTSSSSRVQTGNMSTASQSFTLPDATTLSKGSPIFVFHNKGDYPFGIRDSAGTLLLAVAPGGSVGLALYDNSTAAGLWAPDGGRGLDAGFIIGDNTYSSTYTSVSTPQVALSATKSAHLFRDSSGQPYVSIVDHSTYPATFGTATLIKAANTAVQNAFMLSASKLVVALADNSVFNIAVSGTTPTPSTSATSAAFGNSTFTTIPTAVNLGSSLILAAYSNAGTLTVQAVDCSGTNPSAGTAATGSATIKQICGVFATSATAAIILYIDDSGTAGSPYSLRALVASTSGTTVTLNTSAGLNDVTADPGNQLSCCAVAAPGSSTATAFAMAYMNTADSDIYLVGITVSGTTVTFGTGNKAEAGTFVDPTYNLNNASRFNPNLFGLTSSTVLFTYSDGTAQSRHVVATLSGTTFSFGTPLYGLWTGGTGFNLPQSATGFLCVDTGSSMQQVKNVTISGTTLTVVGTEAPPFSFSAGSSRYVGTSGGFYAASYQPGSGIDRGRLILLKRRANGRPQITGTFSLNDATWPSGMPIPVELASNRVGFQSTSLRTSDGASANYVRVVIVEFPSLGAAN